MSTTIDQANTKPSGEPRNQVNLGGRLCLSSASHGSWANSPLCKQSAGSGEVTVQFPERSPFRKDNVTITSVPGEVILTLVSDSGEDTLPCHYYIKPPSGPRLRIIWGGEGAKVTRPR